MPARALHQRAFFRNCVNFAFHALGGPGVQEAFEEGDIAEVEFEVGRVRNITRGTELAARALPPQLLALVMADGIFPLLEREGSIAPRTEQERSS